MAEARVSEARKLGFKTCIVPKALESKLKSTFKDVEIIGVSSISDAMKIF
jgi:DNA repair protein RadA/Sms